MNLQQIANCLQFIATTPDKSVWKTTTSHLFKLDLVKYFSVNDPGVIIELGAAQGHTTGLLSLLGDAVIAVDFDEANIAIINSMQLANVTTLCADLYDDKISLRLCSAGTVMIDAVHTKEAVEHDIKTALATNCRYIIFDDYGMFPDVRAVIDNFIKKNNCKITFIGLHPGASLPNTCNKQLGHWEGVICAI